MYLFCLQKLNEYNPVRFLLLQLYYACLSPWPPYYLYNSYFTAMTVPKPYLSITLTSCCGNLLSFVSMQRITGSKKLFFFISDRTLEKEILREADRVFQIIGIIITAWSEQCFMLYIDMPRLFIESEKCGHHPMTLAWCTKQTYTVFTLMKQKCMGMYW